jgi:hemoglobin
MTKVKRHTCDFFGAGSGGPEQYTGRTMQDTHRGMNISEQEYAAVVDDIRNAMIKNNIDEQTRNEVLQIADQLKNDIINI